MATAQEAQRIRFCADEVALAARSNPAVAEQLVQEIELLAARNPEPLFEAYNLRAKGNLFQIRGSMTEAVQCYRSALALFEQSNEPVECARTASTLVGALAPLGEFEEALRLAEKARQIFQEADLQVRAARLDVNVGNLYHRLNRLEEALVRYDRAAIVLEKSDDREAAAGVLINRSVMLMLLYRFDDAMNGFLRARAFSREHGLAVLATQSEYNRAYLLFLTGDYGQALRLMQLAEAEFLEIGDEIHVAQCRLDRGEILLRLNLPEHARELAVLAEKGFESSGLKGDRSRALLLLGRCLLQAGQTTEPATHFSEARRLFQDEGNAIWAAMADLEIAAALRASGNIHEAVELSEKAGEVFRSEKHSSFSALADALSARLCIERRDPGRALFFLSRCEESLKFQPPAWFRYHIEYLKGRALELLGRFQEARDSFGAATESLEFLLTHITVDHAMVRFLEDKEDVYERLAGLSDDVSQAFELVDRAKTRAFTTAWSRAEKPHEASGKVRHLRETLRSDYLRLFQSGAAHPAGLSERIKSSEHQLMRELLESEFRHARPPQPSARVEALNLSGDEVVLEYFLKDDTVSVFVVRNGFLEWVTLPISTSELREEVNFTRCGLSRAGNPRREPALRHHLRRLYDVLIAPVKDLLRRRIVIILHRFLHHLPFHALMGPDGYLGEEYVTSYAPSLAAYALACRKESVSSVNSLVVGTEAPDLPSLSAELRNVAEYLPNCTIAINRSLREIRPALEAASFVHIATHGLFRSENPGASLLNLGSDVLTPTDMLDMRINAELVTMSACSTGQNYVRSNDIQGFVRAFSIWGVRSLIASLWEVNDRATAMLMTRFYERIKNSPDIAENLRCAILDVKQLYPHPYYWAGFVLIGKPQLGRSWDGIRTN